MFAPRFSPWLRLVWFGIGAAIGQTAFSLVILAALSVAARLSGQSSDAALTEGMTRYALWMSVLSYPPIWLWLMFCRRHFDRRSVRSLGLRLESWGRSIGGGMLAGTLAITWLFGVLWLCGGVRFEGWSPDAFDQTPIAIVGYLLLYAGAFAGVGFMEEVIFRGYLLHNLSVSLGLRRAIWLQAIVFALVHLGNAAMNTQNAPNAETVRAIWLDALRAMPSIALIGAIFALCWAKTGSLWFPIGFHAAWNFCLGCIFSLPVSGLQTFRLFDISPIGSTWLNGGSFGAEGSVLLWPILGLLWWALLRVPDHPQIALDLNLLNPNQAFEPMPAAPVAAPTGADVVADDTPHQSRFKTSMRQKDADENAPIALWGQLERTAPDPNATPSTWATPDNETPNFAAPQTETPSRENPIIAAPQTETPNRETTNFAAPATVSVSPASSDATRDEWKFSEFTPPARDVTPPTTNITAEASDAEIATVERAENTNTSREFASTPETTQAENLQIETSPSEISASSAPVTTPTTIAETNSADAPVVKPRPPAPRW